jgi:hypothetical protein
MRRLDEDGIRVIVLYVNPYIDARNAGGMANMPGTLLSIHAVEQVPYILENIWATLGRTRR